MEGVSHVHRSLVFLFMELGTCGVSILNHSISIDGKVCWRQDLHGSKSSKKGVGCGGGNCHLHASRLCQDGSGFRPCINSFS